MDLRNPKVTNYLRIEDGLGVTNYLVNPELNVDEIIENSLDTPNLDYMPAGDIPPNPAEILMNERVDQIFEYAKDNYDFIVVDSAPVGLVIDALVIAKNIDMSIYVIRSNFLDKRMLHIPKDLHKDHKLPGMTILLNAVKQEKSAYGYGYGYKKEDNKSPLDKILKVFRSN